ncbi:hypothetical protein SPHINGOAX6_71203 [Sphingomonas sp. AX6]|nr:hypothetical protein SPHINGOAX6_71203 [Sphingomonas sp. AX6]
MDLAPRLASPADPARHAAPRKSGGADRPFRQGISLDLSGFRLTAPLATRGVRLVRKKLTFCLQTGLG